MDNKDKEMSKESNKSLIPMAMELSVMTSEIQFSKSGVSLASIIFASTIKVKRFGDIIVYVSKYFV